MGQNNTQWSVTQHCYELYVYAIASFITNKNLKSFDKYNLCDTLWTMPLKETQNYKNTSIVTRHLHQYLTSMANCLPSHNYTEVTSYMSSAQIWSHLPTLFIQHLQEKFHTSKCDAPKYELPQLGLVGGMTPNMNISWSVANGTKISHKT